MKRIIGFSNIRIICLVLSTCVITVGIGTTILRGGFNFGIDFRAGIEQRIEISDRDVDVTEVREALSELGTIQVRSLSVPNQFTIRVQDPGTVDNFVDVVSKRVLDLLNTRFGDVTELAVSYVGPRFSSRIARQSGLLASLALGLILVYVWIRFRLMFAIAAIIALIHDLCIMLVFLGVTQIEVSTASVAAILTIIGYSLNDTIVIFDRIRENEELMHESSYDTIINASITQSLSRTIITSLTTLLAVIAIFVFSTGTVRNFALNMIVGVLVGTYSSIFIASPALVGWRSIVKRRRKAREAQRFGTAETVKEQRVSKSPDAIDANATAQILDVEAVKREISQRKQQISAQKRTSGGKKKRKR